MTITIPNLLRQLPKLVGDQPDPRWWRASLTLRGSDGISREDFFTRPEEERITLIHERIITRAPWKPLRQIDIPKAHAAGETRPICWATVIDTALLYVLADAVSAYAETVLGDTCLAFRPRRALDRSIRRAIQTLRRRGLYCACVIDIKAFFDSIPWKRLDATIDDLPADGDVKTLLKQLVRVRVQRTDGTVVDRTSGIPQGLQVSPVLANLVLASFDRRAQKTLSRWGVLVRRYADDILLLAPDLKTLDRARGFVTAQLQWEGLQIKLGTGACVDLREDGTTARWLGIELSTTDIGGKRGLMLGVPEATIQEKADNLLAELEAGIITVEEVEARLYGLERFYGSILSETKTEEIIHSIWERIIPIQGKEPLQAVRLWMRLVGLGPHEKKEVKTKTIESVIYPTHSLRKNHVPPMGDGLDDGAGDRDRLLPPHGEEAAGITRTKGRSSLSLYAGPGRGGGGGLALDGNTEGLSDEMDGSTPGSIQDGLQLSPLGGPSRPDILVGRDGAPADSRPSRYLETGGVLVRAEARGGRAVQIDVMGGASWSEVVTVPNSRSTAEAVLAGFEHAAGRLAAEGHDDIALTTTEPTISGYVSRGWRIGSVRVLRRLRALQRVGPQIVFSGAVSEVGSVGVGGAIAAPPASDDSRQKEGRDRNGP